jgi:hypothetical protein
MAITKGFCHGKIIRPSVDELVKKDHLYRKILELVAFEGLTRFFRLNLSKYGRPGYNLLCTFKVLILQWMEDLSDRELERFLQENTAAKLFCGFSLTFDQFNYITKTDKAFYQIMRSKS